MKSTEGKSIFLDTLVNILDQNAFQDVISWTDQGNSFVIHKLKDFSEEILPSWFKHKNFASFHRQLNLYGFVRDKTSTVGKAFKHSLFVRNRPDLIANIHKKQKESILPVMLKKATPASKYMFICKAIAELDAKSAKIGENLNGLTEKIEELVDQNQIIVDGNSSSVQDLERAKNILIYFANWFKSNPCKFNIFKKQADCTRRKNSEVEEISERYSPEMLTYYQNDDFLF